ncbi:MAG TPA: pyridoxal phosphate-dependent aminotransferase [Methylibium sp.]|uniref:pyridoxal phosphate-dependent aminotransferase n=1 Tax=Methylibium sp. TaxID=2067992 RepID=UPI002DBBE41A|nr:pyridoxal phosphate-dependent aminotransferase [Methylibium sp.]HEU4457532.1 pyridoxal phosphate-dependent aminotransferase [Methylibium sp.]
MRTARRVDRIDPFYVMECAKAAQRIAATPACDPARGGEPMLYLNIGEPDFGAVPAVAEAARACLADVRTQYTQAAGLPALREAIAGWYATRWSLDVDPARIVVTAGASAALQLATLLLFEAGDEVLMPDPSYPCNRHFVAAADATPVLLHCGPPQRYQPDAGQIDAAWTDATRGVLLASPSNPTGTSIAFDELARIVDVVRVRGGVTLIDEIYLGLSYEAAYSRSALALPGAADALISINSFSKTFCMTGWRLGWLVLPAALVPAVEKLAQNLYICPSSLAQHAALACFTPESLAEVERRRLVFQARRDFIVPRLEAIGLRVPVRPDGAFYAWIDASAHTQDSWRFAFELMERAHVALTPGRDFGRHGVERYLRLSYATGLEQLDAAVGRLERVLG